jgi:hypothetical protein
MQIKKPGSLIAPTLEKNHKPGRSSRGMEREE